MRRKEKEERKERRKKKEKQREREGGERKKKDKKKEKRERGMKEKMKEKRKRKAYLRPRSKRDAAVRAVLLLATQKVKVRALCDDNAAILEHFFAVHKRIVSVHVLDHTAASFMHPVHDCDHVVLHDGVAVPVKRGRVAVVAFIAHLL